MTPTNVPVGAILMYAADSTYQLQDQNWMSCDGSILSKTDFGDLWNVIGYSNGGADDLFQLPDLQGRFLRGSTAEKAPGVTADFTTKNPGFKVTLNNIPTSSNKADAGASGPASRQMIRWKSGDSSSFDVEGGDKETRPVNMYVNFIIKTRADTNALPAGCIIPYAGSDDALVVPDLSWLACDGNQYSAGQYQALNKTLGHRFTSTTAKAHFNVPLIRGFFLRGVDLHGARDPDVAAREPAPDTTCGAHVGTMQACATSARGLKVRIAHYPSDNVEIFPTRPCHNLEDGRYDSSQAWSGGDRESRPVNAAVQFYIHSGPAVPDKPNPDPFPLGAIVAVPGSAALPADYWLPADGSELSVSDFRDLHDVLQDAWGATSSPENSFRLPDLRGRFLRATDLSVKDAPDDTKWGDPDRTTRTNSQGTGSFQGTGSLQGCATALPRNPFSIKANSPHSNRQTAATAVGYDIAAFCGSSSFDVSGGDDETAPAHVYVNFWIKAKKMTV